MGTKTPKGPTGWIQVGPWGDRCPRKTLKGPIGQIQMGPWGHLYPPKDPNGHNDPQWAQRPQKDP